MIIPKHWGPREPGAFSPARMMLHAEAAALTGGRGFRQPKKPSRELDAAERSKRRLRRSLKGFRP